MVLVQRWGRTVRCMVGSERRPDPTRVSDQAALRSASGTSWLGWGAITAAIVAVVMVYMAIREPALGWTCFAIVLVVYALMVIVRIAVPVGRIRLVSLAVLDGVIVLTGLVGVIGVLLRST